LEERGGVAHLAIVGAQDLSSDPILGLGEFASNFLGVFAVRGLLTRFGSDESILLWPVAALLPLLDAWAIVAALAVVTETVVALTAELAVYALTISAVVASRVVTRALVAIAAIVTGLRAFDLSISGGFRLGLGRFALRVLIFEINVIAGHELVAADDVRQRP